MAYHHGVVRGSAPGRPAGLDAQREQGVEIEVGPLGKAASMQGAAIPLEVAMTRPILFTAMLLLCACSLGGPRAADLESGQHDCDYCHRNITQMEFASQLVVKGESPLFFDDLSCLRGYLASVATPPAQAAIFVTDHRTGNWIPADTAVFSRVMTLRTPMGSHLLAHESAASRDSDSLAVRPVAVEPTELIPAEWRTAVASQ